MVPRKSAYDSIQEACAGASTSYIYIRLIPRVLDDKRERPTTPFPSVSTRIMDEITKKNKRFSFRFVLYLVSAYPPCLDFEYQVFVYPRCGLLIPCIPRYYRGAYQIEPNIVSKYSDIYIYTRVYIYIYIYIYILDFVCIVGPTRYLVCPPVKEELPNKAHALSTILMRQ